MSKLLYVLTNTDLGWDCVCGVFKEESHILDYLNEGRDPDSDTYYHTLDDLNDTSYVIHKEYLYE